MGILPSKIYLMKHISIKVHFHFPIRPSYKTSQWNIFPVDVICEFILFMKIGNANSYRSIALLTWSFLPNTISLRIIITMGFWWCILQNIFCQGVYFAV